MHINGKRGWREERRKAKKKKIKRIKKWGKVYPSEMRLLLVTRRIKEKDGGGEIIIIAVKMWKASQKATSMSAVEWNERFLLHFPFTIREDDKKETLCQWGCSSFAVQATGRQWWNEIHFMIITLILLCCSLVWCKELFFVSPLNPTNPHKTSLLYARIEKEGKSIIFIDLLGIIIKQIN